MLLVDPRAGSKELIRPLEQSGLEVEPQTLAFGDVAFQSKDKQWVGVEYKTLADCIASMRDGRLTGHQLRGMRDKTFKPDTPGLRLPYTYLWLVIEGEWRHDGQGRICTYKGPRLGWKPAPGAMAAAEFEKRILGLQLRLGVYVWPTARRVDTVRYLTNLYRDFVDSTAEDHTSHLAPHMQTHLVELSPFREAVMAWPGVGVKASKAAEGAFRRNGKPSLSRAATAKLSEWAELSTVDNKGSSRKVGMKTATQIIEFLN
jgi:ERCC4-type nuclease